MSGNRPSLQSAPESSVMQTRRRIEENVAASSSPQAGRRTSEEKRARILSHFYPEVGAGGFTRVDGTVAFYTRVNALLDKSMVVADVGAGRGAALHDDPCTYRRELQRLRGKVARVIGLDIDEAVHENPGLDEAHVIAPGSRFPLGDGSIDLIISDFTFEHVEKPKPFASELDRILKPGGWICARTPNKWNYVSLAARLLPEIVQGRLLSWLQPGRKREDIFPTRYLMNTRRTLRSLFPPERYEDFSYTYSAEPSYAPPIRVVWSLLLLWEALCPEAMRSNIFAFLRKRGRLEDTPRC